MAGWYDHGNSDLPVPTNKVLIKGGANIADKNLITPRGVVTKVNDAEMTLLQENPIFQLHKKNGFVSIQEKHTEIEVVVADMQGRDNSAPLVEEDFTDKDGAKPIVSKKGKK